MGLHSSSITSPPSPTLTKVTSHTSSHPFEQDNLLNIEKDGLCQNQVKTSEMDAKLPVDYHLEKVTLVES